jgi:hypothetical protein
MSTTDMKIIGIGGLHLSFGEQTQQIAEREDIEVVEACCPSLSRDVPPVLRNWEIATGGLATLQAKRQGGERG